MTVGAARAEMAAVRAVRIDADFIVAGFEAEQFR